jgi:6-phosphogluconolactonase
MVHLALDHTQRTLVAASYGSSKILSVRVSPDGNLSAPVTQIHLTGHGPNASRQKSPHAHGVCATPGNRFILINDLGTDRIMIYKLDPETAELTPNNPAFFSAAPGSGPRHTTFHPNGRWAYSINEINSTISLMNWDAKQGVLTLVDNYPTLPPGGDVANNRAGEVIIARQGRFLYACNRGAVEEMLTYSIGREGRLTLVERTTLSGKEARHFAVSPDDGYLLVAEQFSDKVAVFSRDREKGTLQATSGSYDLPTPSCIIFA